MSSEDRLFPRRFEYRCATSVDDALDDLSRAGADTKTLAGGQSLIPLMKLRLATPLRVLDVGRLGALTGVGVKAGVLRIGALTRHAFFEQHEPPRGLDILAEATHVIGDRQVRNMGTMGGALAEVDPAGDWGAALVALDATVGCRSVRGERTLTIDDLMVDAYTSALAPDELLTDIRVPLSAAGGGSCYMKLERKAGDFAIASVGVAVRAPGGARGRATAVDETPIRVTVNGVVHERRVEPRLLLVSFLREHLRLTGTHIGCDTSHCGACTVLLDGDNVKSCTVLAVQANERAVTTIEGVAAGTQLHPVQEAFWNNHALQCGYCTPGMVMSALALLTRTPAPDEDTVRHAIAGNLCRCTGYQFIVDAVLEAAERMRSAPAPA